MSAPIPSNACLGEPVPAYCVTCGAWCAQSAPIITHRGVIATFRTCPECERRPAMPWKVYRSAVTGEWVTAEYAAEHPDTTVSETVNPREHSSRVIAQYAVHEAGDPADETPEPDAG